MEIILFLLPIAIILGGSFIVFFIWATKTGQYDDLDSPAKRMLFEDLNINTNNQTRKEKK